MKSFSTLGLLLAMLLVAFCDAAGDWKHTCRDYKLVGTLMLEATCQQPPGEPELCTRLDLNGCYANDNGHLVARDEGNFEDSCGTCTMTGTKFGCICGSTTSGTPRLAYIDTNDLIWNDNGHLRCFGHTGDTCPK